MKCTICGNGAMSTCEKWYTVDVSAPGDKNCKDIKVCEECLNEVIFDWIRDNSDWAIKNEYTSDDFKRDYVTEIDIEFEDLDQDSDERNNQINMWEDEMCE